MRLETALNRLYINAYLTASRRVEKVNNQGNGQQEKQKNIKPRSKADTEDNSHKVDIMC